MKKEELKKILNSIQPTKNEKEQMQRVVDNFQKLLMNNVKGNVRIAEYHIGGSFRKGTIIRGRKEVDIVVVISPKNNQKLAYNDLARASMDSIENVLRTQYYDRLVESKNNQKIDRDYERNTLSLKDINGIKIDFLIKFKKEHLTQCNEKNIENFYLERDNQQLKFIELANKKYPLYKNSIMLLKYFRNFNGINFLKSYAIEIILYYSLDKYLKGNDYSDYMVAFTKGLTDFINKATIKVPNDINCALGVKNSQCSVGNYKVIDVANNSNNITSGITEKQVATIKKFLEFLKINFGVITQEKKLVAKIGLYYCDKSEATFEWRLIVNSKIVKQGGNYLCNSVTNDKEVKVLLRALSKTIKYASDNNISNITINMEERDYNMIVNSSIDGYDIGSNNRNSIRSQLGNASKKGIIISFKKI